MSSLKISRYRTIDRSILLRQVRCRKLATNSESIADVDDSTVRVLCAVVSAERAWDSHICHEAFHDINIGGRALIVHAVRPMSMRSAADDNHDV